MGSDAGDAVTFLSELSFLSTDAKVIFADDFSPMHDVVSEMLETLGSTNEPLHAYSGEEAIKLAKSHEDVDLILSDWNMPEVTGLDFLRYCRESDSLKDVPFVMITGEAEVAQITEAVKAGVTGYLTKPFSIKNLKDRLLKIDGTKLAG